MATIDRYRLQVQVDGADRVEQLDQSMKETTVSVGNLERRLTQFAAAGIAAFTALGASAIRTAKQINDLAGTAGFSAGEIMQMSMAAEASGGSFDQMGVTLLRFSSNMEQAIEGNDRLRKSLEQVGIGTEELRNLDDQELFRRVVEGLAAMEDGAVKTGLTVQLLGRQMATTDLARFTELTRDAVDPEMDRRLQNAAKLVTQMGRAFREAQLVALELMEPLIRALGDLEINAENVKKAMQLLGAAIAAAMAPKVVALVVGVTAAMRALGIAVAAVFTKKAALISLIPGIGAATVIASIATAAGAYVALGRVLDDTKQKADNATNAIAGASTGAGTDTGAGRDVMLTAQERRLASMRRTSEQMVLQNRLANNLRQTSIALMGNESDRVQVEQQNMRIRAEAQQQTLRINNQIAELREQDAEGNREIINQLIFQKALVATQREEVIALNRAEAERAMHLRNISVNKEIALADTQNELQLAREIAQEDAMRARIRGEMTQQQMNDLLELQNLERGHAATMFGLQIQMQAAVNSGNTIEQRRLRELMHLEELRFTAAEKHVLKLRALQQELEQSMTAGMASAMDQLSQQFTPYQMAQDAVLQGWNTINNAIVNLANTGKLSFRDMARSILRDLALMIVRAQVFQAIMGIGSALNIAGAVGSLFGAPAAAPAGGNGGFGIFGLGGMIPAGQVGLVGERGPEFIRGPAQITPIKQSDMTAQPTQVNYYIEAIDTQSFQDRLAQDPEFVFGVTQRGSRSFA